MTKKILDKVYNTACTDLWPLYAKLAKSYDQEVFKNGHVTPLRIAAALGRYLQDLSISSLDYGCDTGISGQALQEARFLTIDGIDISDEMVDVAAQKRFIDTWNCLRLKPARTPQWGHIT